MRRNLIDKDKLLDFMRNRYSIHIEKDSDITVGEVQAIRKTIDAIISRIEAMPVEQDYLCSDCALYNKDWGSQ